MDQIEREVGWLTQTVGVCVVEGVALLRVSGGDARTWLNDVASEVGQLDAGVALHTTIVGGVGKPAADALVYDPGGTRLIAPEPGEPIIAVPSASARDVATSLLARIGERDVQVHPAALAIVRAIGPRADDVAAKVIVPSLGSFATQRDGLAGRDWLVTSADRDAAFAELVAAAEAIGGGAVSSQGIAAAAESKGVRQER